MTALVYMIFFCTGSQPCISVPSLGVFPTAKACIAELEAMRPKWGVVTGDRLDMRGSRPHEAYECVRRTVSGP